MKQEIKSEAKQVGVLALGFGLVGIDRYLITPLFPIIAKTCTLGTATLAPSPVRWPLRGALPRCSWGTCQIAWDVGACW